MNCQPLAPRRPRTLRRRKGALLRNRSAAEIRTRAPGLILGPRPSLLSALPRPGKDGSQAHLTLSWADAAISHFRKNPWFLPGRRMSQCTDLKQTVQ